MTLLDVFVEIAADRGGVEELLVVLLGDAVVHVVRPGEELNMQLAGFRGVSNAGYICGDDRYELDIQGLIGLNA